MTGPVPGSSAMRDRRSQLTIAAVAFLLGLLVVVQLRTQTGGSALQKMSAQDLTTLVANLNTETTSSAPRSAASRASSTSSGQTRRTARPRSSRSRRSSAGSGPGPASIRSPGAGVTIVVNGAIDADAVDALLNELRNAGAEAIAVDDVRVVPGTTVGGGPGSLDVDRPLLRDPFTIRAIGRPDTLVGSLTRAGGIIAQLAATNPAATLDIQPIGRADETAGDPGLVPDQGIRVLIRSAG